MGKQFGLVKTLDSFFIENDSTDDEERLNSINKLLSIGFHLNQELSTGDTFVETMVHLGGMIVLIK